MPGARGRGRREGVRPQERQPAPRRARRSKGDSKKGKSASKAATDWRGRRLSGRSLRYSATTPTFNIMVSLRKQTLVSKWKMLLLLLRVRKAVHETYPDKKWKRNCRWIMALHGRHLGAIWGPRRCGSTDVLQTRKSFGWRSEVREERPDGSCLHHTGGTPGRQDVSLGRLRVRRRSRYDFAGKIVWSWLQKPIAVDNRRRRRDVRLIVEKGHSPGSSASSAHP